MLTRALVLLAAALSGASALRLSPAAAPGAVASRVGRHAPVRMDATEERIKEMIDENKM